MVAQPTTLPQQVRRPGVVPSGEAGAPRTATPLDLFPAGLDEIIAGLLPQSHMDGKLKNDVPAAGFAPHPPFIDNNMHRSRIVVKGRGHRSIEREGYLFNLKFAVAHALFKFNTTGSPASIADVKLKTGESLACLVVAHLISLKARSTREAHLAVSRVGQKNRYLPMEEGYAQKIVDLLPRLAHLFSDSRNDQRNGTQEASDHQDRDQGTSAHTQKSPHVRAPHPCHYTV